MEDNQIGRIQSLYDDAIERQADTIRRGYRKEIERLTDRMEREIIWMRCERRSAMLKEIHDLDQHDANNAKEVI